MSKKYPNDMDYRAALPCPKCGVENECFNIATGYLGCPNCETEYKIPRAIMRFENIQTDEPHGVVADLMAGPQLIKAGYMKDLLRFIDEKQYIVDGVNYSSYQVAKQKEKSSDG